MLILKFIRKNHKRFVTLVFAMFSKKTIRDVDFTDKTVLVRADYNVPLKDGKVMDDYRIRKNVPTIQYLLGQNAKVIIISHLGRPGGEVNKSLSLEPIAQRLSELLDKPVAFCETTIGDGAKQAAKNLKLGEVLLLENLRFHKQEKANDAQFAKQLAELADYFVQDGFGVVHRAHASTEAITQFLPSVAGLLLEKEVEVVDKAIEDPEKPLVTIVGGAKIAGKIDLLDRFLKASDTVIIGGAMANTFLVASGYDIGESKYDADETDSAREIMEHCSLSKTKLMLPILDVAVGTSFDEYSERHEVATDDVAKTDMIMDFGPQTVEDIKQVLKSSGTIIWNGPLGVIELEKFKWSTEEVANFIANEKLTCIVGGGDSAGFIHKLGLIDKFTHVSTGGGASLELMAGRKLPGVEALMAK